MSNVLTLFGYGSLLDFNSVLSTLPSATSFRKAALIGYRRHYNLVSVGAIIHGSCNLETLEVAALSIRPDSGSLVLGSIFEINSDEFIPYLEREHRYKAVQVDSIYDSKGTKLQAWTVIEQTDDEYRRGMDAEEYHSRVGKYYNGELWGRKDIFPLRSYMINSLLASYRLGGDEYLCNMLDQTYLADQSTTLREYINKVRDRFPEDFLGLVSGHSPPKVLSSL